jgi:hypothetical protein
MAKWVAEQLEELLIQINEVPYTDDREHIQLTILMGGFAKLNQSAMKKAAIKARTRINDMSPVSKPKEKAQDNDMTRLRPIR